MVNFLFDMTQRPHMTTDALAKVAGAAKSTLSRKSQAICDLFRILPMDPELCRRELLADNPLAWMIKVDGFIVDARMLPAELFSSLSYLILLARAPSPLGHRPFPPRFPLS